MALSDTKIRNAKPQEKLYKLTDRDGLTLFINPNGSLLWKLRYNFNKKPNTLALGAYPAVSLKEARERCAEARKLLGAGLDPNAEKRRKIDEAKIASTNTFKAIADELNEKRRADGFAPATLRKSEWFTSFLVDAFENTPISNIKRRDVHDVLQSIEKKGTYETAKRCARFASNIFEYALNTGRIEYNPATSIAKALVVPKVEHYAAIIEPKAVGQLMRDIAAYQGRAFPLHRIAKRVYLARAIGRANGDPPPVVLHRLEQFLTKFTARGQGKIDVVGRVIEAVDHGDLRIQHFTHEERCRQLLAPELGQRGNAGWLFHHSPVFVYASSLVIF